MKTSSIKKDPVGDLLNKLDVNKPFGLKRVHPQVLRVLDNVIARPLLVISKKSWQLGEIPEDWKKANATPISKQDGKKDQKVKQIILETISTLHKGQEVRFLTVFYCTPIDKLMKYGLDKCTVKWV
ncbi:hypothetical protein QYF61_001347 [Mycteria americana]|uniref:Uncharacterized protein n=1 Tax=Mycteria americana TaxID=33587 RepID=A0AAN7RPV9_MYCAM|nr:hypothetical protein QYF61_001347 [Mycteria americana]